MHNNLRTWQQDALEVYQQALKQGKKQLLWEATPGAGKTTAALQLCHHQLETLRRRRVVVVVPTAHLKTQWAQAATRFNIHLDDNYKPGQRLARDYHGVVLTYQQVGNQPQAYRGLAKGAVAVMDEIHHAADGLLWGDSLQQTFAEAAFVLALSGTAFRSDNNTIPFVRYEDGESVPDFTYDYGRAIEDGICRSVAFFTYGGEVAWMEDGDIVESKFTEAVTGSLAGRRLQVALDPKSGWMKTMLEDAQQMLRETQQEHPEAAGLLVAADQEHARQLAHLLHTVSGRKPVVVLSDDSRASRKIKRFTNSRQDWLVACNMVSEGVDIPRLRVGVYATTITTRLYFRQFLGRIVRVTPQPNEVQVAYCYLPADLRLRVLAERIEAQQRHVLSSQAAFVDERERAPQVREERPDWEALQAKNSGMEAVIVHGGQLTLWTEPGLTGHHARVKQEVQRKVSERVRTPSLSKSEQKGNLAREIKQLVGWYHGQSGQPHQFIHAELNRQQGVRSQTECTEQQLHDRAKILRRWLSR